MKKVFISTSTFAQEDGRPLDLLKRAGLDIYLNSRGRKLTEDEIADFIAGKDFLIAGTEPITKRVMCLAKNLKIISRCGAGLENIDLNAANQLGIKVFNTPYGPTQAVAELTVGLMLDLIRMVGPMDRDIRKGIWKKRMGYLLKGKRIGIVGLGRIGRKVAQLLFPFEVGIAYFDTNLKDGALPYIYKPLEELLKWADIVTLHCPAPQNGKLLIGKTELKKIRKGAWFINVSRGELVDEEALCDALNAGCLSGAAIDTFMNEPYAGPLAGLDNVILTPHIGSYAKESRIEMELQSVTNLLEGINKL